MMIHNNPKQMMMKIMIVMKILLKQFKNGVSIKKHRKAHIIPYINYNIRTDMELHYKCLMFFYHGEMKKKTYGGYSTYTEHYNAEKTTIMPICLKYEKRNDSLQKAIEQISAEDQNCDSTDSEDDDNVT